MPAEVRALEEEIASGSGVEDHRETIRERLRPLRHLFKLSRYRPATNGRVRISDPELAGGRRRRGREQEDYGNQGQRGGVGGNVYALFQAPEGPRGKDVEPEFWPQIDWVSVNHDPPSRTPPHLEDRAARYDRTANRLEINEDFRVFQDTMSRWREQYGAIPGAASMIEAQVREWYAQVLVETVLGAEALRGSHYWSDQELATLLSQEALTAAVQPRYFIEERLKRDLGRRLGPAEAAAVAVAGSG